MNEFEKNIKNKLYYYETPVGKFIINGSTKFKAYSLFFRNEVSMTASSPEKLIFYVSNFCLCDPNWDDYKGEIKNVPQTLNEWDKYSPYLEETS